MTKERTQPVLATSDGVRTRNHLPARPSIRRFAHPGVHRKKIVSAQLFAFPLQRSKHWRPCIARYAPALLPFANVPLMHANISGHLGDRLPAIEDIGKVLHRDKHTRDGLSRQALPNGSVTHGPARGTMCPMGRGTSPAQFKRDFCEKLAAARKLHGYSQSEFAGLMGMTRDRYAKYETRTPLPHHLVPIACDILEIDPGVLYGIRKQEVRKAG
jgi:DNA-binding XRE family transcriptional regulator